ncbi:hypothetical protein EVAR_17270_1 [Eumeta japonica]|uniref:Uncharacterized protein n=1 Tax=Eumeta variegata TaxID=151549 RepID=A0A4C1TT15_EUMVA|nr:hypothetical protein EVAR_17270_1 [Eumeta japonica]
MYCACDALASFPALHGSYPLARDNYIIASISKRNNNNLRAAALRECVSTSAVVEACAAARTTPTSIKHQHFILSIRETYFTVSIV